MDLVNNVVLDDITIGIRADSPATCEQQDERSDVWRYFPGGPAVYAVSVSDTEAEARVAVESAAGDLLGVYRTRPGYSRVSRPKVHLEGFDDAVLLDFRWAERHGAEMHSVALVAAWGTRVVVVHGTVPASQPSDEYEAMERVVLSCRPITEGVSR